MKGSLSPGDDPDELACFACGARVPVDTIVKNMLANMNSQAPDLAVSEMQASPRSAPGDTGDVTASMTAMLETSMLGLVTELAEVEERRRQLKLGLRRGRVALRILRGEKARSVMWSEEKRAAQAERMRKVMEGKRPKAEDRVAQGGKRARSAGTPHNWSDEARAGAAERMRKLNEQKRQEKEAQA
jgi:hypothetical protein